MCVCNPCPAGGNQELWDQVVVARTFCREFRVGATWVCDKNPEKKKKQETQVWGMVFTTYSW